MFLILFMMPDNYSKLTRFIEIGERMAKCAGTSNPIDSFLACHLATKASYRAGKMINGCREGSLTEIHLTTSRLLGVGDEMAKTFVDVEIDYETERLSPNALLIDFVRMHCEKGGRAILVSDMYMTLIKSRNLLIKQALIQVFLSRFFQCQHQGVQGFWWNFQPN